MVALHAPRRFELDAGLFPIRRIPGTDRPIAAIRGNPVRLPPGTPFVRSSPFSEYRPTHFFLRLWSGWERRTIENTGTAASRRTRYVGR
jgi:hypothetical protein